MPRAANTLARYGLSASEAVRADLAAIGLTETPTAGSERDGRAVLVALSRAGRPELALQQLARIVTGLGAAPAARHDDVTDLLDALHGTMDFRSRLIGLLGGSETLGDHLATHPAAWRALADPPDLTDPALHQRWGAALHAAIHDENGRPLPTPAALDPLRTAYRTCLAEIAAADLAPAVEPGSAGPTLSAVCIGLTALADRLLATALDLARHVHPAPGRLAVIAMGKCGGRELNYVSDVDVLFVACAEDLDDDDVAPADLAAATAQAHTMMQLCQDVAWEVDAGLRPEGRHGPLVRSLAAYQAYYDRWAKTWEFQALLKARPAAGDPALGERFMTLVRPHVWTAADREAFVADVQAMRRRVEDTVPAADRPREFKLGPGGLRDVEFAVQLLQLVHGRGDESLREPGTLAALAALTAGGYVGRDDGAELAESYAYQRRLEHLLQLQHLRRTHSIPASAADVDWLARADGYPVGRGTTGAGSRLVAELDRRVAVVRRLHEKLFYRPLMTAVAAVPTSELRLTPDAAISRLAALGFTAPQAALQHLAALTDGVSRRAAIQRTLLPVLLGTFADAPDPDAGLLAYRQVSDALAATPWFLRLLRDEGLVAQRLARLLGTSRLVGDLLQRAPEVLRLLVHDSALVGADPAARSGVATSALQMRAARAATATAAAGAARSARRHEMLRIACGDLLGMLDARAVADGLTAIADAAVGAALQAAYRQVTESETDLLARVAVIGLGRFGGGEMGYSSDADVLFVAEPALDDADPARVQAQATMIAETTARLLSAVSPDPPLNVDTDLRPEGRGGRLVRSVASYRQYWQRHLRPWERQALLRARPVAGDDEVATAFVRELDPIRYPAGGLADDDAREIRRIKARVDSERLPRGADPALHTKLGRGGLSDVEWTVQLLQLQHAGTAPTLRHTATLAAIDGAVRADLLDDADAAALRTAWLAATRARNAIMLVTGKPGDEIPAHGTVLAGIARACGYPDNEDPGVFIDDYRRATRRARRVVDRLFDAD